MPRFVTCGPNEAIIVSGCCRASPTIRAGGRVFVWPVFHRVQRISLNTMTLNVESQKVYSEEGVPVTLKGVAQVKVQGKDLASLRAASEMFLDKTEDEIMEIAKATLDGHQRSNIARMAIGKIYTMRNEFAKRVQQDAQTDLIDMGLTLVSYTVQDITDDEGYLDALGHSKTVAVRSEARKEIAQAKALSETKNLETENSKKEREILNQQSVALKQLDFERAQAEYLKHHFENQAKSEKAGDLKLASMKDLITRQEYEVLLFEKEKEIELIKKKKRLKELELKNQVESKAEFECKRDIELAEAYEKKAISEAKVEAEKIKKLAEARAEIIKKQKEADAEVLVKRAEAFDKFGEAAKLEMVLAILPRLTAEIAGPITECKKITSVSQDGSVGFSRVTNEIQEVMLQLCGSVGNFTRQPLTNSTSGNSNNNNNDTDNPNAPDNKKNTGQAAIEGTSTSSQYLDKTRTYSSLATRFTRGT